MIFLKKTLNNLCGEGCQTAICNLYLPYNASFHKYASKFGGIVWVGGVVKVVGGGIGETP